MVREEKGRKFINSLVSGFLMFLAYSLVLLRIASANCTDTPTNTGTCGFFWGQASLNCAQVQVGDVIRAYIDTVVINNGCVGRWVVTTVGFYGAMALWADDSTTTQHDGARAGDIIRFSICRGGVEYLCNQTVTWDPVLHLNTYIELNLSSESTYYLDTDGDGYGQSGSTIHTCDTPPAGYTSNGGDCDDNNSQVNPGASETCDGMDNNCNGSVDEGVLNTYYQDNDGDGYGNVTVTTQACTAPAGYVADSDDCDDTLGSIHPGGTEICDDLDNDCDGDVDEGLPLNTYYLDGDGDNYGDANQTITDCAAPAGYISNADDCNDSAANVYPEAPEIVDGIDNDCDGEVDEDVVMITFYLDADEDGYGDPNESMEDYTTPPGYVDNGLDCNDNNSGINPAAIETCDGMDNDCDGSVDEGVLNTYYQDNDNDGYGNATVTTQACTITVGYVDNSDDCDDTNEEVGDLPPNAYIYGYGYAGCAPVEICFNNYSTGASSYIWDFGDGTSGTEEYPCHTYLQPGSYLATLTAINNCGQNTCQMMIEVYEQDIEMNARPTTGCPPLEAYFEVTATCPDYLIQAWDFGDGTFSSENNPNHTYNEPGVYTVTVIVTDVNTGEETILTQEIVIEPFCSGATDSSIFVWGELVPDGVGLEIGDWIGAFVEDAEVNGGCIGAWEIAYPLAYGAMPVYGDDPSTPEKDGALAGDRIIFKAWDDSERRYINICPNGPDEPIWDPINYALHLDLTNNCQQEIALCQGWNLISFQINKCYYEGNTPAVFIPAGVVEQEIGSFLTWLSDDAASPIRDGSNPGIAGNWQRITSFDEEGAHILDKGLPPMINTLRYMSVGYGYWIKMNAPGVLILEGQTMSPGTTLELHAGWNLIGYLSADKCYGDISIGGVCPYQNGQYNPDENILYTQIGSPDTLVSVVLGSIAGKYRCVTAFDCCQGAKIFDISFPSFINTLHYIGPKYGYWIKIQDPEGGQLIYPD